MKNKDRLRLIRSGKARCDGCLFFREFSQENKSGYYQGTCFYFPPQCVTVENFVAGKRGWVQATDFCGFYEPRE